MTDPEILPDPGHSLAEDVLAREEPCRIDRSTEVRLVIDFVSAPNQRLAIVYGKGGSGKTKLVLDWVIPAMSAMRPVYYGCCKPNVPNRFAKGDEELGLEEALALGAVVFLDDFEQFLLLGDKVQMATTGTTLEKVRSGELRGTLVLILRESNLSQLLAFGPVALSLLENTLEISPLSFHETIEKLNKLRATSGITYDPEVIELLSKDSEQFESSGELDFIQAVDLGFRRFKGDSTDRVVSRTDYDLIGGLQGALREYLADCILAAEQRFGPNASATTQTIVEELVEAATTGRTADFSDIPSRLGVSETLFEDIFHWLKSDRKLLRVVSGDRFDLVPPQLTRVVSREIEPRQQEVGKIRRMLADALRSKQQLDVLLPQDRFEQVEEHRTRLKTSDAEAALLLFSVLRYKDVVDVEPARYWMNRIRSRQARISAAIEPLLSQVTHVRARAAFLLADFDEPQVQGPLYRTALEDPDAGVRSEAVKSLAVMQTAEFWPLLEKEVKDAKSPFRENAVVAMRIFWKVPNCADVLKSLASDHLASDHERLRPIATSTLAALEIPSAVDALVDISLNDEDNDDRQAAASALASIRSEPLICQSLAMLRTSRLKMERLEPMTVQRILGAVPNLLLSFLVVLGNIFLNGLALVPFRRYRIAAIFLTLEVAVIAVLTFRGFSSPLLVVALLLNLVGSQLLATRVGLVAGHEGRRFQLPHILSSVLFFCCLPIFLVIHGSAHNLMGNWRHGARLLFLELLGLLCLGVGYYYFGQWELASLSEGLSHTFFLLYCIVGGILVVSAFVCDVVPVFHTLFLQPGRGQPRERQNAVLRQLLATPTATKLILSTATGEDRQAAKWARRMVRRFASLMPPGNFVEMVRQLGDQSPRFLRRSLKQLKSEVAVRALCRLWNDWSGKAIRRLIFYALAAKPTERSLEALTRLWGQLNWFEKTWLKLAGWHYRLQLWPKTAILAVVLVLPIAGYALHELQIGLNNPALQAMRRLRADLKVNHQDDRAVKAAKYLAEVYPEKSGDELTRAFDSLNDKSSQNLKAGMAESIAVLACGSDPKVGTNAVQTLVSALMKRRQEVKSALAHIVRERCKVPPDGAKGLGDEASRILASDDASSEEVFLAFDALKAAADSRAIQVLRDFALRPGTATRIRWKDVETARNEQAARVQEDLLKVEALEALAWIGNGEAGQALRDIGEKTSSLSLRQAASDRLKGSNSLKSIQFAFDTADYQRVLIDGQRIEQSMLDDDSRVRLLSLLGEASFHLSREDRARQDELEGEAIRYFQKAQTIPGQASVSRSLAEVHDARAQRFLSQGRKDQALQEAASALQSDAAFAQAYATRGSILYEQNKRAEALEAFAKATELNPKDAWALCVQASIRLDAGEFEAASQIARTAVDADPKYSWSYGLLSESYTKQGKDEEAIALFEKLKEIHPDIYWPGRQLASLYQNHSSNPGPSSFERVYRMYVELDRRFASTLKGDTLASHQANFLESRFTTGRYDEVLEGGKQLLQKLPPEDYILRIPVGVLTYAVAVLKNDVPAATSQLSELEATIAKLPTDQITTWSYQGTLHYLKAQSLSPDRADPLIRLVEAADGLRERKPIPKTLIEANRAALADARGKD